MILQCSSADCRKWQHVKCIAEYAVQQIGQSTFLYSTTRNSFDVAEEASGTKKPTLKKPRPKDVRISKDSAAVAKAETDSFYAEVFVKGMPNGLNSTPSTRSEVLVTTKGNEDKQSRVVTCLFCHKEIDE